MSAKTYKILLVDDDAALRKVYEMQFESYPQYQLVVASSTKEALKILEEQKPDLILLDLILGKDPQTPLSERDKMEGFNFLDFVKMEDEYKEIPVIILSNLDSQADMDKARHAGASDYLVKAKTLPSEVIQRIHGFLE